MSSSATLWTIARQAHLSMRILQAIWSELPCPPTGNLPDPGTEPESLMSPALAGGFLTTSATWEAQAHVSRVWLFATPWTVASQGPPSMGFSRQEYWSGLPLPSPGDLPHPGIEPWSPTFRQTPYRPSHQGSPSTHHTSLIISFR